MNRELSTADFVAAGDHEKEQKQEHREEPRGERPQPLFPAGVAQDLQTQWEHVQADFVDDPRSAVKRADELVALAMKRLAETFAKERSGLEQAWDRGNDVSTEDLRLALQRYRSFFQRLLSV